MRWATIYSGFFGALLLAGDVSAVPAASLRENYQPIIDRNPFGLKPPPPPPTNNPAGAIKEKPKLEIFLTGITSIGQPRFPKQAYIMTREQGKKEPEYYALSEGMEKDGLKIVSIDDTGKKVRIMMEDKETLLSFQSHGVTPPAAPAVGRPGVPGQPGVPMPGQVPGQPGMQPQPGVPGAPAQAGYDNQGQPVYAQPQQQFDQAAAAVTPGMRQIPSRSLRVRSPDATGGNYAPGNPPQLGGAGAQPQQQQEQVDFAEQYLRMHLNRTAKEQQGTPMPPLPVIPN